MTLFLTNLGRAKLSTSLLFYLECLRKNVLNRIQFTLFHNFFWETCLWQVPFFVYKCLSISKKIIIHHFLWNIEIPCWEYTSEYTIRHLRGHIICATLFQFKRLSGKMEKNLHKYYSQIYNLQILLLLLLLLKMLIRAIIPFRYSQI